MRETRRMSASLPLDPPHSESPTARRWRGALPWIALVALLVVAQSLLVGLTLNYEATRAQDDVDTAAAEAGSSVRHTLGRDLQDLQALVWLDPNQSPWRSQAVELLRTRREILRIERRDGAQTIADSANSPFTPPLFRNFPRDLWDSEIRQACVNALRLASPVFSRSYFVPQATGIGHEVIDLCVPVLSEGVPTGYLIATFSLGLLLEESVGEAIMRTHEVTFVEGDRTRLARAGLARGAGVYVGERLIDLPGITLVLRVDSSTGRPRVIPNFTTSLVLVLSLALGAVVYLLVRDVRKRAGAEAALAEALAFRKAMEDSLVAGLRARDLHGRITYVNPAFCDIVGFAPEDLIGRTTPPYWPPELTAQYERRQTERMAGIQPPRDGMETTFIRKSGERVPVLVFEAPLVDRSGKQTGWMSAVLDMSAQRRVEELSRQQQERLQATARLATVGEMASLLSHELNQPLAAIASYSTGSLNLMNDGPPDGETLEMLRQATQRIAEQAERAGRIIKSVHDFVRRREQAREGMRVEHLIDAVLPLVRLQARKSGTSVEVDVAGVTPETPVRVVCDRTMLEQVLLNLTRNGIQAMETHTAAADRQLVIRVRQDGPRWVRFSVIDRGAGVAPEIANQLFTPFFTTRAEGMGLGLSLCRTVIEQHGGTLDHYNLPDGIDGKPTGVEFRFTLPAERAARQAPAQLPRPEPADITPR
ncbi:hypothetical protein BH09PSE5_BH09PSE5_35120 [soil metagenome]